MVQPAQFTVGRAIQSTVVGESYLACAASHHPAKSLSCPSLPALRFLATSRGSCALSALSPGQARAQPEPSPSPVVRLGPEISYARARKTRAQARALSPARARTTLQFENAVAVGVMDA